MACAAKRYDIALVKPQRVVSGPRLDVVGMKPARPTLARTTSATLIPIALIKSTEQRLPFSRGVKSLPFWRTSINVIRVEGTAPSRHSIPATSQMWLRGRCLLFQDRPCCSRVLFTRKRVYHAGRLHVVVCAFEVEPARTSGDAEVAQFVIDALRISTNDLRYVVGRQPFDKVFVSQPVGIEVFCFHACILTPSTAPVK